ncbi:MAG TPA: SRPBCC family protein [Acidimicrobiales bacterium]|nr:SRPBCC family protein [Acidimicrobiales bacterium]
MALAPPVIEYRREFEFPVTPAALWAAIEDTEAFESWWPWLREFTIEGGSLRTGSVLRGVVVPPLPYRMRVQVELVRCRRPNLIDARVHGDLEGDARLRLHRIAGGTRAEVAWKVEMMQRSMRLASRLAHPVLVRAHNVVVEVTVSGFRRQLAAAERDRTGA